MAASKAKPPVVTTKTGAVTKPKTSADPAFEKYLGTDPQYMATVSELGQTMTDFLAEKTQKLGEYGVQYRRDIADLAQSKKQTQLDTGRSFASRGLIRGSGLYNQAVARYNEQYNKQQTGLDVNKVNFEAGLNRSQSQLEHQSLAAKNQARIAAAARRAAKLGLIL